MMPASESCRRAPIARAFLAVRLFFAGDGEEAADSSSVATVGRKLTADATTMRASDEMNMLALAVLCWPCAVDLTPRSHSTERGNAEETKYLSHSTLCEHIHTLARVSWKEHSFESK